ncbi:MAG TPA: NAD(P)-dependent oxidoreductase [Terrimesophilobacter sp.]|nr:NAD(P)-dependent oxidoreductase [Terrimesophilobacter sp.]HRP98828.1 NAD(P)-dependent oxidoreductase [Terrimesophilobacter sp.]
MLGFIGLGNMGEPMARRIVQGGVALLVFDVRPGAADRLVAAGAALAASVAQVAAEADEGYLVCVSDDHQVIEIVDEICASPADLTGRTVVVHSTVTPETMFTIARSAAMRGMTVMDAAVSGNTEAREAGRLTIFAGGAPEDLFRFRPVFELCAESIYEAGPVGAGSALKLANNILALVGLLATAEAWELARGYGIPLPVLREAVSVSTGDLYAMRNLEFFQQLYREHPQGNSEGFYEFMRKDLWSAVSAAKNAGIDLHLTAAAAATAPAVYEKFWAEDSMPEVLAPGC